MRVTFFVFSISIVAILQLLNGCRPENEVGMPFPGWQPGEMDIHHIYTGRGEANFLIFPDGTSMLIDAGDWDPKDYPKMCEEKPDSSRRAGAWIARYIEHVNPNHSQVDYLMISHFHNDHTGDCTNQAPLTTGRNPDYVLTGIAEVGETIHFGKVFDRGYPDYQYPLPIQEPDVENYRTFINWKVAKDGLLQERFEVGHCNQIALLKEPRKYRDLFSIQNLSANGEVWTGKGTETIRYYDLNPQNLSTWQNENTKSIGLRISYGPFRYYTAGDISGEVLDNTGRPIDLEERIGQACGPVDVCKANHHAYLDAMSEGFVRNIRARNYVIPVWDFEHIQPEIIRRILSPQLYIGERTIYPTNLPEALYEKYEKDDWMKAVCRQDGHIVVKVYNEGRHYKIYVLSTEDERMIVKDVRNYEILTVRHN